MANDHNLKPLQKGADSRRSPGGARPGAGRKPLAATQLKAKLADFIDEAQRAFQFCVDMMDNKDVEPSLRLAAAKEVMDRVLGKAKQAVDHSVELKGRIVLVRPGS